MIKIKEFATTTLNLKDEIFIIYITFIISSTFNIKVYPSYQVQMAFLKAGETHMANLYKYIDFADIISPDFIVKFLKYIEINNYLIYLVDS